MEEKKFRFDISSAMLHIIAMACMLMDHIGGTVLSHDVFRIIGRIAFPIFAFMTVEGYFHTRSLKKYMLRLLIFALIAEIPFNLMIGGSLIYPFHQNVLITFLLSLGAIWLIEKAKSTKKVWLFIVVGFLVTLTGYILGFAIMCDYYGGGILMVLVFYFFRKKKWYNLIGQIIALWWINAEMLGGLGYDLNIFGYDFFLPQQAFAILALIPIWLYNGRKGHSSVAFKYICYAFYPAHMLILYLALVALN